MDIEKKKLQVFYEKRAFKKRLNLLGYGNYKDYLKSEHWKNKKDEYKKSSQAQYCLICLNKNYILHHRSYRHIGDESIYDFVPLCRTCHYRVHRYMKENFLPVCKTHLCILKEFNLNKGQLKKMLEPIRKKKNKSTFTFKDNSRTDVLKEFRKSLKKPTRRS